MGNDRPLSHPRLNANRVGNPGGACARGKERGRDGRSQALQGGRERESEGKQEEAVLEGGEARNGGLWKAEKRRRGRRRDVETEDGVASGGGEG